MPSPTLANMQDRTSQQSMTGDVLAIKTLLISLRRILMDEKENVDNDINQNIFEENPDNIESEELIDVAAAIGRLSAAASVCNNQENYSDSVKDITDTAMRKTVEENEDLKRKIVLLQQQLEEKERRTRVLEKLLVGEGKLSNNSDRGEKADLANTATQTDRCPRTVSVETTRIPKTCLSLTGPKQANSQSPTVSHLSASHLQILQPYRSRSSHSLRGGAHMPNRRAESPNSPAARQSATPNKHSNLASSSFSVSSGSSSSSYLSSPNHIGVVHSNFTNQDHSLTGRIGSISLSRTFPRNNATNQVQQYATASSSSQSITSGSDSSSTSYLPSPRAGRSRSSHSPKKVPRARSPAIKCASSSSSSSASSRHGWLYSQQFNCAADSSRGREDRFNNNNTVIRPYKPTIL